MIKTFAFILVATLAACTGSAEVHYSGDSSRPELVALDDAPGVAVVANADEPTFYASHTYWLYRDHTWYQSSSHVSGWSRASDAPVAITRINQPEHYVHYRRGEAGMHTAAPDAPPAGGPLGGPPGGPQGGPPGRPVIRDHRESPDAPMPAEQMRAPMHEPNSQGPNPPAANPLPPTQVPPAAMPNQPGAVH